MGSESYNNPQKTSRLLLGPEQFTRPQTLKLYDEDPDDFFVKVIPCIEIATNFFTKSDESNIVPFISWPNLLFSS
jgi:hypothetical protein